MSAYVAGLRQAVTPGCTVIDLGAGPGLFALLACQFGAGHVWAIEPDPSIHLGGNWRATMVLPSGSLSCRGCRPISARPRRWMS